MHIYIYIHIHIHIHIYIYIERERDIERDVYIYMYMYREKERERERERDMFILPVLHALPNSNFSYLLMRTTSMGFTSIDKIRIKVLSKAHPLY